MDDLISRQAAIDAFHTWFRDGFDEDKWWNSTHVLAAIEGIPSVHQKHKWETCFECPLSHGCPKIKGCTNEQAMEYASKIPNDCPLSAPPVDAISRQAAINEAFEVDTKEYGRIEVVGVDAIESLPPVTPQPKTGKWIYEKNLKQFFCNKCGYPSLTDDDKYIYSMDLPNFCENCGAKMVEPQESEVQDADSD